MKRFPNADLIIVLSLCLITFLASFMNLRNGHEWGGDFSQYIAQGRAVCQGTVPEFRRDNLFIIENSSEGLGMPVYSWGFPLLLSLFMKLGADSIFLMKFSGVLSLCVCVAAVYLMSAKKAGRPAAVTVSLLAALSPELLGASDQIMSDLPYSAFALLSLLFMEKLGYMKPEEKRGNKSAGRTMVLTAALTGFFSLYATEIRSNGYALILTFICGLLLAQLKDRIIFTKNILWKPGMISSFTVFAVYGAGLILFRLILPGSPESSSMFGRNFLSVMLVNTERNLFVMRKLFALNDVYASYIFFFCFLCLALAGFIACFEKNFLAAIYCAGSFFLYMIWPYDQGMRFLYSIALLMLPAAASGFGLIARKTFSGRVTAALSFFLIFLALMNAVHGGIRNIRAKRTMEHGAYSADAEDIFGYISENTGKDSVIMFKKPRVLYFRTGRPGFTPPADRLKDRISDADYILTCTELDPYDEDVLRESGVKLSRVYENDRFLLRKVERGN